MKQKFSTIIPGEINSILLNHLIREDGDEDLCFGLYNPSTGSSRLTAIVDEVILPKEGDRQIHGNVSFNPCYFERVLQIAHQKKKGIVFLHSHPSSGFQSMSNDDVKAETQMAGAIKSVTGFPLLGMTTGNDGYWSARFWSKSKTRKRKYNVEWCESVRVLNNRLNFHFNPNLAIPLINEKKLLRTLSAWGRKTQEDISRIKVGIVGLGSVGSMVAEALARTGFANITLIDFDLVEEKNLDRLMNVRTRDIGKRKVDVISQYIKENATAGRIKVNVIPLSIYEEMAYKAALDCDILFSCVDRPHPRQILNYISYVHLIPVIDGGILARSNKSNTKLIGADWKIQTVGYGRPCLQCLGQFSDHLAGLDKDGLLDDPKYMEGVDDSIRKIVSNENVFAFSMNVASFEVLQLLSLIVLPEPLAKIKQQFYHFTLGDFDTPNIHSCTEKCLYSNLTGTGDSSGITVYKHYSKPDT